MRALIGSEASRDHGSYGRVGMSRSLVGLKSFMPRPARSAEKGFTPKRSRRPSGVSRETSRGLSVCCLLYHRSSGETEQSQIDTLNWILDHDVLDLRLLAFWACFPMILPLDKEAMDYAEYTRNPEKYGFKKVIWEPYYWEHETMNSEVAASLAEHCQNLWLEKKGKVFFKFLSGLPLFALLRIQSR